MSIKGCHLLLNRAATCIAIKQERERGEEMRGEERRGEERRESGTYKEYIVFQVQCNSASYVIYSLIITIIL